MFTLWLFQRSTFEARLDRSLMRTFDQMTSNIQSCAEQIVDARAPDEPSVMDSTWRFSQIHVYLYLNIL